MTDTFHGGWDEGGFYLSFDIDDLNGEIDLAGMVRLRLAQSDVLELVAFLKREHALEYADEFEREQARFEASRGSLRADLRDGYDPSDPKHPDWHDNMAAIHDMREGK